MAEKKVELTISIEIPGIYEADAERLYFVINEEIDKFNLNSAKILMDKATHRQIYVPRRHAMPPKGS